MFDDHIFAMVVLGCLTMISLVALLVAFILGFTLLQIIMFIVSLVCMIAFSNEMIKFEKGE